METLRCPKCLNPLFDGGAKKCSACGARLKARGRSGIGDDEIAARPRALVERELQARIEAQTARGFRQRRRAAKTARRIAALPPSLFDAAGAALVDTGTGSWSTSSAPNPPVIDLPVSAIHDVKRLRVESEVVHVREPEPLALVAPIIEIAPEPEPEPEPEPVAAVPEPEPAPMDAMPGRVHRRRSARVEHRWRLRRTSRPVANDTPTLPVFETIGASLFEHDDAPRVDRPELFEGTLDDEAAVVPELAIVAVPEPIVAVPEIEPEPEPVLMPVPERVDEPEPEPVAAVPEPEPLEVAPEAEPLVEPEPEPIVVAPKRAARPKWQPASVAPRGADAWQPSTSLWARRVFDAGNPREQTVAWPRPYEPPADDDLARDYIDAEVAEPSRTD